jgi:hypothetical protein
LDAGGIGAGGVGGEAVGALQNLQKRKAGREMDSGPAFLLVSFRCAGAFHQQQFQSCFFAADFARISAVAE